MLSDTEKIQRLKNPNTLLRQCWRIKIIHFVDSFDFSSGEKKTRSDFSVLWEIRRTKTLARSFGIVEESRLRFWWIDVVVLAPEIGDPELSVERISALAALFFVVVVAEIVLALQPNLAPGAPLSTCRPRRGTAVVGFAGWAVLRREAVGLEVARLHAHSGGGVRGEERDGDRVRGEPAVPAVPQQLADQHFEAEAPGQGPRYRRGLRHALQGQWAMARSRRARPARPRCPDGSQVRLSGMAFWFLG